MIHEIKEMLAESAEGLNSVSVGLSRVARAADHDGWTCETSKTIEELQKTINEISAECYHYAGDQCTDDFDESSSIEDWFFGFIGFSAGVCVGVLLMSFV